jgi:sugar phosphate isomerase/epimerase
MKMMCQGAKHIWQRKRIQVILLKYVRLKCSLDSKQVDDRCMYGPEIIELQLFEKDLTETVILIQTIRKLKQLGIKVYLHQPITYKNKKLDIMSTDLETIEYYQWSCDRLSEICKQENVRCVVHAHYSKSESSYYEGLSYTRKMKERIQRMNRTSGDYFLWENTTKGLFSFANPYIFSEVIEPLNLPLCFDVSHAFISFKGSNNKLIHVVNLVHEYIRYYHVVDSKGIHHDALALGKGKIDWKSLKHHLLQKDFIFEIGLKDWLDCTPMIQSADYFIKL